MSTAKRFPLATWFRKTRRLVGISAQRGSRRLHLQGQGQRNYRTLHPRHLATTAAPSTAPSAATGTADVSSLLAADYILPNSAAGELTKNDLRRLDKTTLNLALNEIYARHGRKFTDPAIQAHFNAKSWYHPTVSGQDFDMSILNRYEIYNINLITDYQSEMGYR